PRPDRRCEPSAARHRARAARGGRRLGARSGRPEARAARVSTQPARDRALRIVRLRPGGPPPRALPPRRRLPRRDPYGAAARSPGVGVLKDAALVAPRTPGSDRTIVRLRGGPCGSPERAALPGAVAHPRAYCSRARP